MNKHWNVTKAEYLEALELSRDGNTSPEHSAAYWQLCRFYRGQIFYRNQAALALRLLRGLAEAAAIHPRYHFDLICPRCNKTSETVSDKRVPPPHVNCGDCLMADCEITEMKVLKVKRIECEGGNHAPL